MFEIKSNTVEDTLQFGAALARIIEPGVVVSLVGELGAGKTLFVKGVAEALGITTPIKSPTYTIVKEYEIEENHLMLYHIDAYRLEDGGAESIDMPDFISHDAITFVEWAQFVNKYMPSSYIEVKIVNEGDNQRAIIVTAEGDNARNSRLVRKWEQVWKG